MKKIDRVREFLVRLNNAHVDQLLLARDHETGVAASAELHGRIVETLTAILAHIECVYAIEPVGFVDP